MDLNPERNELRDSERWEVCISSTWIMNLFKEGKEEKQKKITALYRYYLYHISFTTQITPEQGNNIIFYFTCHWSLISRCDSDTIEFSDQSNYLKEIFIKKTKQIMNTTLSQFSAMSPFKKGGKIVCVVCASKPWGQWWLIVSTFHWFFTWCSSSFASVF